MQQRNETDKNSQVKHQQQQPRKIKQTAPPTTIIKALKIFWNRNDFTDDDSWMNLASLYALHVYIICIAIYGVIRRDIWKKERKEHDETRSHIGLPCMRSTTNSHFSPFIRWHFNFIFFVCWRCWQNRPIITPQHSISLNSFQAFARLFPFSIFAFYFILFKIDCVIAMQNVLHM